MRQDLASRDEELEQSRSGLRKADEQVKAMQESLQSAASRNRTMEVRPEMRDSKICLLHILRSENTCR